jgi:iron complex transport system ATP-binding protein
VDRIDGAAGGDGAVLTVSNLCLSVPARAQSGRGDHKGKAHATRGQRVLLQDASWRFAPGELWCVAGPNGAGKSTLLAALAGLSRPAAGHILLDSRPLEAWPLADLARRRAFMPQNTQDAFSASVYDTVMTGRHPYLGAWGWETEADRLAVEAALDAAHATAFAEQDVTTLSGGERQRVALATVLAQQAPLLLCDEPLSHLDLPHQVDCLRLLRARARVSGDTVVFVCHDVNLGRAFASHAVLLDGKGGWRAGPAAQVLAPEPLREAFAFPMVEIRDGEHRMLAPDFSGPGDAPGFQASE